MEKQEYLFCIRCGRKLKTAEARERGMGKICAKKYQEKEMRNKLFNKEVKDAKSNSPV